MPFKLGRVDSEIRALQDDLQFFINGLIEYGDRDSSLTKQIHARERPRLFGNVIPGTFPRIVTRHAWVTALSLSSVDKELMWAEEPSTGITFEGMVAQCWIVTVPISGTYGIIPELHLIRAKECNEPETLKTLIQLAKDILAN